MGVSQMLKKISALAILTLVLILVSVASNTDTVQAQAKVNTGSLRIVNALPGIGAVDVYLDEQVIANALKPGDVTIYYVIAAGRHALAVRAVGGGALSAPIADILIDLEPNGSQTAVIYQTQFADGSASRVTINQSSAVFIINDDRSPIQLGRTRITAVHLAVGTPERISIGYPSGEALLYQIGLKQPFGTIDVDTKPYNLAILNADAPPSSIPPVLERLGEINFYANTLYTFIVVPNAVPAASEGQVGALSAQTKTYVLSAPLEPPLENGLRLRIVHAAHSTAVVDVYIDERLVASRLNYGDFTEYLGLADYSHTITIRRFGDNPNDPNVKPLARGSLTRTNQNSKQIDYTLLLVNSDAQNTAAVQSLATSNTSPDTSVNAPLIFQTQNGDVMMTLLPDDLSETRHGLARVRIINAADGVQAITVFTPAYPVVPPPASAAGIVPTTAPTLTPVPPPGIALASNAAFAAEASEGEVPSGLYSRLSFIPASATNAITTATNVQFVAGVIYTFVVMGSPSGNPPVKAVVLQDYGSGLALARAYSGVLLGNANVRAQPDSTSARVIQLPKNTEIDVLGRNSNNQWIRIRFINPNTGTTTEGWVAVQANVVTITRNGSPILPSTLPLFAGS
jgi:hypothetical protein